MPEHATIPIFSPQWWIGFWITAIVITALIYYAKNLTITGERKFRYGLATVFLARDLFHQAFMVYHDAWYIQTNLPLQLCSISGLISIFILYKPQQQLFEFLALLGLPAAIQSFLTPELTQGGGLYQHVDYYLGHGAILTTALYMHLILGMKPRVGSWLKVFLWANALIVVVGGINYLLGSNYIYLCTPPIAANPLVMGGWPWYLIGFEIAGLAHILLFYYLFRRKKKMTVPQPFKQSATNPRIH